VLPRARGEAQRMIQEAQGYRERLENEAEGEAQRFLQVYQAYSQNPAVTKRRMYLETMQNVLSDTDKVIMDRGGPGVVPYLPLNELRRRSGAATQ
jgi:membrane protease subunit HflK